jgi:hypothetical protein
MKHSIKDSSSDRAGSALSIGERAAAPAEDEEGELQMREKGDRELGGPYDVVPRVCGLTNTAEFDKPGRRYGTSAE